MTIKLLNKIGYTIIELLLVTSIVGVVPITLYLEAAKHAKTADCISNLRNIYIGVQLYELDFEKLPDAEFYPKSGKDDPKSIVNILSGYIDDKRVFICLAMPDELQKRSLTYIWNDSYNGRLLDSVGSKSSEWLMTDMTAAEAKIPPPHQGFYNVLFFDGHVVGVKETIYLSPTPADLEKTPKDKFYTKLEKQRL